MEKNNDQATHYTSTLPLKVHPQGTGLGTSVGHRIMDVVLFIYCDDAWVCRAALKVRYIPMDSEAAIGCL